jgi:hypothetical protein
VKKWRANKDFRWEDFLTKSTNHPILETNRNKRTDTATQRPRPTATQRQSKGLGTRLNKTEMPRGGARWRPT